MRKIIELAGIAALGVLLSADHGRSESGSGIDPLVVTGITNLPTFGVGVADVALTGSGDLACLEGVAGKVVRLKGFEISATATGAIVVDVGVVLRSTLDTGGTPTTYTPVRFDPINTTPAAATVRMFSTAPTPGTPVGNGTIRTAKLAVGAQGSSTGPIEEKDFTFYGRYSQAVVLRSATDAACLNVGASGAGASYNVDVEWTETSL